MKTSVVIPSYNCQTWLPHAVRTSLDQTHKDVEVIVVNDASTDMTYEILDWYNKNEPRVKVINNEKNLGRSASRNLGNYHAQGEIIMVLDADDLSTPNRAEITVKKFKTKSPDYVYGHATVINAIGTPNAILGADVFDIETTKKKLVNLIVHSSAAYTHTFADKYPYETGEAARLGVDDFCQQIKAKVNGAIFDFVPQRLCCYRVLEEGVSQKRDKQETWDFKRKYVDSLLAVAA